MVTEQKDWPFLASAAKAYPGPMNVKLSEVLIEGMVRKATAPEDEMLVLGRWKNVLKRKAKVEFTNPLTGKRKMASHKDDEEDKYLGGMRNPRQALQRIPGYRQAGISIYKSEMDGALREA